MENRERYCGEGDKEINAIKVNKSQVENRQLTFINFQQRVSS